ncbi:MAG: hypothetical protein J6K45_08355 [Clostridia bacterium]|nr:hypothetical protein [Clostridia bacterium]
MYRRETLVTDGKDQIVLVCKDGWGIENFKIFSESNLAVDVGYTLKPVRTTKILDWNKDFLLFPPAVYRAYYVLDLKQKKLFRANLIHVWSRFPKNFAKKAIILAKYTDAEFSIQERSKDLRVCGDDIQYRLNNTQSFIDEDDMPGSIHVLDFKSKEVQKVRQVIFLS